ncbi:hypothetical protein JZ751_028738, partial [Albula glossodonta]
MNPSGLSCPNKPETARLDGSGCYRAGGAGLLHLSRLATSPEQFGGGSQGFESNRADTPQGAVSVGSPSFATLKCSLRKQSK